jgi:molybdopterin-containing oxidoreductase family iron-sulfur binding subunit
MERNKRYFQSVEELTGDPSIEAARVQELAPPPREGDGSDVARRDFLKTVGVTFAAAGLSAACSRLPERYVVPYANKPEDVTPGRALWFATTCSGCSAGCGVVMKSRDGRPIKVEGNPSHPLANGWSGDQNGLGGVCARGQASVLNLYDGDRLRKPVVGGKEVAWQELDAEAAKLLAPYKTGGGQLLVVSKRVTGPASRAALEQLLAAFPGARHVEFEPAELSAIRAAHKLTHGVAIVPQPSFARASVVVSLGADFLGTWLQPVAFSKAWAQTRRLSVAKKEMSRLLVAETQMSLTGTNADERVRVLPSEERAIAFGLARRVGVPGMPEVATDKGKLLDAWAKELKGAKGQALVLSGSSDVAVQAAVNAINNELRAENNTVLLNQPLHAGGDDEALHKALDDLKSGALTGVVLWDVNPAYGNGRAKVWAEAIAKAPASLAITTRLDETAKLCKLAAATHHPLEAWGDSEPQAGVVNLQQPLVRPLFGTRAPLETLLVWSGSTSTPAGDDVSYAWLRQSWQRLVLPRVYGGDFESFWAKTVQNGFAQTGREMVRAGGPADAAVPQPADASPVGSLPAAAALPEGVSAVDLAAGATAVGLPGAASETAALVRPPEARFDPAGVARAVALPEAKAAGAGPFALVLHETVGLGRGEHANNPFLQELPDPVSKATWGNYASLSPKAAQKLGVGTHDVVKVSAGEVSVELPVLLQPGLHDDAVALPLGYGRTAVGRIGNGLGVDVSGFGALGAKVQVAIAKTGKTDTIALAQTHHSYEHRTDVVRETTLEEWQKNPASENEPLNAALKDPAAMPGSVMASRQTRSIWSRHEYKGYRWGMAIDLNSCTGCGACVIACNIENNIPVVGKSEVIIRREMHWIRIDRYYAEKPTNKPKHGDYDWSPTADDLLDLADSPLTVHQPMLCQHCENAPCETVCPVLATVHTSEGLNAQVYNRCIGTRYCANNCPYKVRRFNWFNYPHGDMLDDSGAPKQDVDLVALALNPDITKRSRGVMEKCSFCVQRIQDAKSEAVRAGRLQEGTALRDGDVLTACQQSCPADAITFGNINDDASAVVKAFRDPRNFAALAEVGTQPVVSYHTKVRNVVAAADAKSEG